MIITSLFTFFAGQNSQIVVNSRVNRMANRTGAERLDGRVLKIDGGRAQVCWPKGVKTDECVNCLVAIVE